MARQKVNLEKPLKYSLCDDNMGLLERAGLAGLYLALQGADEWAKDEDTETGIQARQLKCLFHPWDLSRATELTLDWDGDDPLTPFKALVKWAWQVRDGVFFLPGIHRTPAERNNWYLRVPTHNGILNTFFQHNKTRPKIIGSSIADEDDTAFIQIDTNTTIKIPSFPVIADSDKGKPNLPKQHKKIENILSSKDVKLSSAYYPGIAPRFCPDKEWIGAPKDAILLLFVPFACLFLELPRNRISLQNGTRRFFSNYAVVIPDIVDLSGYASAWLRLYPDLQERFARISCKSLEDAALRVAVEYATKPTRKAMVQVGATPALHIFCMGRTSHSKYSKIQMVRKQHLEIQPQRKVLSRYERLMAYMDNRIVPLSDAAKSAENGRASHYIRTLSGRGRIAKNLAEGRAWYMDVLIPTDWEHDTLEREREDHNNKNHEDKISSQKLWLRHLQRRPEKEALMALAKEPSMYDSPETEILFVQAIHDMMATIFWKEREALKNRLALRQDTQEFKEKLEKRNEDVIGDLHRSLAEAQTRELFRRTLVTWFAKGGRHQTIREHHKRIWDFVNHPHDWKKARDLALFSLITYGPRSEV